MAHLLKLLQTNVATKKSKNVEVLHLASEVSSYVGALCVGRANLERMLSMHNVPLFNKVGVEGVK